MPRQRINASIFRSGNETFDSVNWKMPVAIICGSRNNADNGCIPAKLLKDSDADRETILMSEKFPEDRAFTTSAKKRVYPQNCGVQQSCS